MYVLNGRPLKLRSFSCTDITSRFPPNQSGLNLTTLNVGGRQGRKQSISFLPIVRSEDVRDRSLIKGKGLQNGKIRVKGLNLSCPPF